MCGIAGAVSLTKEEVNVADVARMSKRLHHRGGDAEGLAQISTTADFVRVFRSASEIRSATESPLRADGNGIGPHQVDIALAHQRFSIVDLTSEADQPFISSDGKICVVFNGEIYNHVELREELRSIGRKFRTNSDTEVLAEAFSVWGPECFSRVNGFWAAAIYDRRVRGLLLTRDRLGKKPLYWSRVGSTVYFASEIKALLEVEDIHRRRRVNERAAYNWLCHGLRDIDHETMFEGIFMFPAAHWAWVSGGFPGNGQCFWRSPRRRLREADLPVDEAASRLRDLIFDAVRIRLRADVPACVELSGGMDSSSLLAAAASIMPDRCSAFTVSFPEAEANEVAYARLVADRYRADHHVLQNSEGSLWPRIREFVDLHEEPFHSPNVRSNQTTWEAMREHGFKVSLHGAAGDELLGGYWQHFSATQISNLRAGRIVSLFRNAREWKDTDRALGGFITTALAPLRAVFGPLAFWRNKHSAAAVCRIAPPDTDIKIFGNSLGTLEDVILEEVERSKVPYWMISTDKNCMGVPVEVRFPFLDYRVVEYCLQLPPTYLIRDGWHKWILRRAFHGLLPDDVLWRKRKMGFPFPMERFLGESSQILDQIVERSDNPFVDMRQCPVARRDWRVVSFLLWYERFFNQNDSLFRDIAALAPPEPPSRFRSRYLLNE